MPPRIPKYRRRPDRDIAFAEHRGQRKYFPGKYDSPESRAAYNRWLRGVLGEVDVPPEIPAGNLTIAALVAAWLDHARLYYLSDGRQSSEYYCLRSAVTPLLKLRGSDLAQFFGPRDLKLVRAEMVKAGWSRETCNAMVGRIRRMFRWAVEHELVAPAVLEAVRAVAPLKKGRTAAPESKPVQPVALEHVAATLPHLPQIVADMVRLHQVTGMRSQDLCALRPCDIDQAADVWLYRPAKHKSDWREGDHARIVAIGPQAQAILAPNLDRPPTAYCFSPAEAEAARRLSRRQARKSRITPSQAARKPAQRRARPPRSHYDTASYRRAITRAIEAANQAAVSEATKHDRQPPKPIPHWHPHQLRHAVGTEVRRRYGLEAAQVVLGHSKADVTEIYAERDLDLAKQVAREMG